MAPPRGAIKWPPSIFDHSLELTREFDRICNKPLVLSKQTVSYIDFLEFGAGVQRLHEKLQELYNNVIPPTQRGPPAGPYPIGYNGVPQYPVGAQPNGGVPSPYKSSTPPAVGNGGTYTVNGGAYRPTLGQVNGINGTSTNGMGNTSRTEGIPVNGQTSALDHTAPYQPAPSPVLHFQNGPQPPKPESALSKSEPTSTTQPLLDETSPLFAQFSESTQQILRRVGVNTSINAPVGITNSTPGTRPSFEGYSQSTEQILSRIKAGHPLHHPSSLPTPTSVHGIQPSEVERARPDSRPMQYRLADREREQREQQAKVQQQHQGPPPWMPPTMPPAMRPALQPPMGYTPQPPVRYVQQPPMRPEMQSFMRPEMQPAIQNGEQPAARIGAQPAMAAGAQPATPSEMQPVLPSGAQPAVRPEAQPAVQTEMQSAPQAERQSEAQSPRQPEHQPESPPAVQPAIQTTEQPTTHTVAQLDNMSSDQTTRERGYSFESDSTLTIQELTPELSSAAPSPIQVAQPPPIQEFQPDPEDDLSELEEDALLDLQHGTDLAMALKTVPVSASAPVPASTPAPATALPPGFEALQSRPEHKDIDNLRRHSSRRTSGSPVTYNLKLLAGTALHTPTKYLAKHIPNVTRTPKLPSTTSLIATPDTSLSLAESRISSRSVSRPDSSKGKASASKASSSRSTRPPRKVRGFTAEQGMRAGQIVMKAFDHAQARMKVKGSTRLERIINERVAKELEDAAHPQANSAAQLTPPESISGSGESPQDTIVIDPGPSKQRNGEPADRSRKRKRKSSPEPATQDLPGVRPAAKTNRIELGSPEEVTPSASRERARGRFVAKSKKTGLANIQVNGKGAGQEKKPTTKSRTSTIEVDTPVTPTTPTGLGEQVTKRGRTVRASTKVKQNLEMMEHGARAGS